MKKVVAALLLGCAVGRAAAAEKADGLQKLAGLSIAPPAQDKFSIPASNSGLPGAGPIRR